MARALASMRSGFLVAAGNGITSPPAAVTGRQPAAGLGQHQRAPAGADDGFGDLHRRQLGAAGIELRDDLQYGRPARAPPSSLSAMAQGFIGWPNTNRNSSMSAAAPTGGASPICAQPAGDAGKPGVVWLCGLKSEMTSTKAAALAEWAREQGLGCLRFDYSGHGQSEGRFEDGTLGRWLEEARAAFSQLTERPAGAGRLQHGRLHRAAAAARADGRGARGGRAHQGAGADRAGLGHDRADVGEPARERAQGDRGEGRLSAPLALRRRALSHHPRLHRGRPRST